MSIKTPKIDKNIVRAKKENSRKKIIMIAFLILVVVAILIGLVVGLTSRQRSTSTTTILQGLQFVFENYKLNRSITVAGVSNGGYLGFAISSSNPIRYYVTNYLENKIFVFDEEWNCFSNRSFTNVNHMIAVGNELYITGDVNVWKTDEQLNVLITYYNSTGWGIYRIAIYYGLYYSPTNNLVYVASYGLQEVHVFNLDLTLNDTI